MVTLYSTHCPKCKMLEKQLRAKNIEFEENNDVAYMLSRGIQFVPMLEVNGQLLDFAKAWKWTEEKG